MLSAAILANHTLIRKHRCRRGSIVLALALGVVASNNCSPTLAFVTRSQRLSYRIPFESSSSRLIMPVATRSRTTHGTIASTSLKAVPKSSQPPPRSTKKKDGKKPADTKSMPVVSARIDVPNVSSSSSTVSSLTSFTSAASTTTVSTSSNERVLVPSSPPKRRRTSDNVKGSDEDGTLSPTCVTPTKSKASTRRGTSGTENDSKDEFVPSGLVTPLPPSVVKKSVQRKKASPVAARAKRSLKKKLQQRDPPLDWEATFELVHELRADRTAPVDSDGAEQLGQVELGPKVWRFQVLVALLLSSQTKDAVVGDAMRALQHHGLTVEHIHHDTSHEQVNALIGKVGFHNNKTKYLKQIVDILLREYGGDIPTTAADMMTLPGMGPKMSFLVESIAWNVTTGIGVDTHLHRMFNQLSYVTSKNPEQTRQQLESWLPRDQWSSVNLIWVGFGQEIQQQKEKSLRKALSCSQPIQALTLLKQLDFPISKEAKKYGLEQEISNVMNAIQPNH
mmetsp:Transcript_28147/g.51261  ORF Transcript_28147/g.51261 Transcript_28147/m.51261 type:complete len:506 (-) Transcript_28147:265-1782(-)